MFYLLFLKLSLQLGWNEDRIMPEGWMLTRFWSIIATGAESLVGLEQGQVSAKGLVSDKGLPIHATGAESPGCGQEARV